MSYHGIEIFFQNLGDADSIFVRHWDQGTLTNILIDGGYKKDHEQVVGFLNDRANETDEDTIHHLVCSHCHDDHAGGLVKLVTDCPEIPINCGWVHDTRQEHQTLNLQRQILLRAFHANRLLDSIQTSEQTRTDLLNALESRGIPIYSPFAGDQIGPLFVLGPSETFFDEQFKKLDSGGQVKVLNERFERRHREWLFGVNAMQLEAADAQKELGGEPTSPENEVSTVLAAIWDGKVNLFTADAGCEGLSAAIDNPHQIDTQDLGWMQLPHHGSRRNMNQDLIDHFSPATAFISCAGTVKHPSKKLVNALKATGSTVYSTHYSTSKSSWLRHAIGNVPDLGCVPADRSTRRAKPSPSFSRMALLPLSGETVLMVENLWNFLALPRDFWICRAVWLWRRACSPEKVSWLKPVKATIGSISTSMGLLCSPGSVAFFPKRAAS